MFNENGEWVMPAKEFDMLELTAAAGGGVGIQSRPGETTLHARVSFETFCRTFNVIRGED